MHKTKLLVVTATTLATLGLVVTATTSAKANEVQDENNTYWVVESGDTLSKISEKYKVDFQTVHANNLDKVSNANLIFVGQKLLVAGKDFQNGAKPVEVQEPVQAEVTYQQADTQPAVVEQAPAPVAQAEPVQAGGIDLNQTSGAVDINALANYLAGAGMSAGYSASEWAYIIQHESNGSVTATNASSGAYGALQLLGHGEYQGMTLGEQIDMARGLPRGSWVVYP